MNIPQVLLNKPAPGAQINFSHPLARGLVACWLFNEQSGRQAYDLSPYKNHGSLYGFNDPTSNDRSSLGLQFNELSTYVDCGNDANFPNGTNNRTVEVWIKRGVIVGSDRILSYGTWNTDNAFECCVNATGKMVLVGHTHNYLSSGDIVPEGTFTVVSFVLDGGRIYFYGNGVLDSSFPTSIDTILGGNFYIGSSVIGTPADCFNGTISLVRMWNGALSPSKIKQSYLEPYVMFL